MTTLPSPGPAFRWCVEPWGHALVCGRLAETAHHLFTTRQLRLRTAEGDSDPAAWAQAARSLGADSERIARVKQVHGRAVRVLRAGTVGPDDLESRPHADAIVSDERGLVLAVQVADCVPILLADHRTGAVGAIHAGWRGTAAGVAQAAVASMSAELGTRAGDLIAAIGPSIGACCYVVGDTVLESFRAAGGTNAQLTRWFSRDAANTLRLDLWTVNRDQLAAAGVPADRIFIAGLCTKTHSELFDSFRADGERAGRMAALIRGS